MSELRKPQPEIRFLGSMSPAADADRTRVLAEGESQGFKVLGIRVVPAVPIAHIANPFADTEIAPPQTVMLPYETAEDAALVQAARDEHQRLLELHGPENVLVVQPSLRLAFEHGHMFPHELFAFMVRSESITKQ
jgi:hypothetical protein